MAHQTWGRWAMVALLSGAAGIAFAPLFVRVSEVGPVATGFWRIALAVPILWLWAALARPQGQPAGDWAQRCRLIGAGLFFAGDLTAWHWSIVMTSVANATLLANCAPILVALVSWRLYGERFSRLFLFGMALAMGGALLLMGDSLSLDLRHFWGDLLGVVAAGFYAGYLLSVSRLRSRHSTASVMAWGGLGSAAALLPVTLLFGEALVPESREGWLVVAGLAGVSQVGGQGLIAFALAHLPAAFSSVSLLVQPALAAVLAWLLLNEPLSLWQGLGGVVILTGIMVARAGTDFGRTTGASSETTS